MKLNNKGFAITSIIYSMLILFLTLVVLIIGNLASRKAVFDKQKDEILNKIQDGDIVETPLLPIAYQQVEYIESTGTQYINTEIIPDQNTGFDIVFLTKNAIAFSPAGGTTGYGAIMGARENSKVNELQITTYTANSEQYDGTLRFGTSGAYNAGITINTKITLTLTNKAYTNNKDLEYTLEKEFKSPVSLTLFALNNNGTITQHGLVQLYSLKIYDGDILVRDYIPCYRKDDNVRGLYDLVYKKFYSNSASGTDDFEMGREV